MRAAAFLAIVIVSVSLGSSVAAQPGDQSTTEEILREAKTALDAGDYQRAEDLAQPVVGLGRHVEAVDRAEARRILGLALFFLNRLGESRDALLSYLRLDPDAHLDPGRYPPEVIVFFEDIRARHRAELSQLRERPRSVREWSKNLLPPLGQFANGQRGKAWFVTGAALGLGAMHLSSFLILNSWCDGATGVCRSGETEVRKTAAVMRWLNLTSGAALIALYIYGVSDGFYNHRRLTRADRAQRMSVAVVATPTGAAASLSLRF